MNGQYDWAYRFSVIAGTVLIFALLLFVVYFVFIHYRLRLKFETEKQKFEQALLQAEIEIREQTLKHISRELHDNIGQIASLIKINLNLLAAESNIIGKERINASLDLVRQMIGDIKSLSYSLNEEHTTGLSFPEQVEKEIERVNKLKTVHVFYEGPIDFPLLQPGVEVFLFRMFQEMVSNMLKHSQSSEARMQIEPGEQKLKILFSDNGIGFNKNALVKGSGLRNLHERCRLIGASLVIDSQPGSGTKIEISIPI